MANREASFGLARRGDLSHRQQRGSDDETSLRFHARLRRPPSPSSVTGSLPVLFFGNALTAKAASVGLNPSKQEYLDPSGQELTGGKRRFETLGSLGCHDRSSLNEEQCERAIAAMRAYFQRGKPVYGWFRPLARVMEAMGFSYQEGGVAHLDLVQEATDPTWSRLKSERPAEAHSLLETDLPFLSWQVEALPLQLLVCNGRTVFDTVTKLFGAEVHESGSFARITWYVSSARVGGRSIAVIGWNLPLVRPTGLGANGEKKLGRLLASHLTERGWHPGSGTTGTQRAAPRASRRTSPERVSRDDLLRLVRTRRRSIRSFLEWADRTEADGESVRWEARRDIEEAREAAGWFEEPWWGVVVFSCFSSLQGAKVVSGSFRRPVDPRRARRLLGEFVFPRGSVGHHRIQPGVKGAKEALVAACERSPDFEGILLRGAEFHERYQKLRELGARQWGRTTCFDLVLRTGALGVGGRRYEPDRAYLDDSTGPKAGFKKVWGIPVTRQNAEWCESLLRAWTENWSLVADEVGAAWTAQPYTPGDFENALCIFQEKFSQGRC